MRALALRLAALLAVSLACGGEKPSPATAAPPRAEPPPPAAPVVSPSPAPEQQAAPPVPAQAAKPAEAAPMVPAKPGAAPAATSPAPVAKPSAKPEAAPEPAMKPAAKPAAPAASAHAKVGADKCRMCHRVQHQSWAESAHAKKGLDCEGCHGNGADYWPAAVMRDREKAVAAGLVLPGADRCKACHAKADASLLPKAHAHKAR